MIPTSNVRELCFAVRLAVINLLYLHMFPVFFFFFFFFFLFLKNYITKARDRTSVLKDWPHQGPVVQSVVSLTSSLRVISLTVLAGSIHNILIFFAEKNVSSFCTAKATHIFSAKNFSIFAYRLI